MLNRDLIPIIFPRYSRFTLLGNTTKWNLLYAHSVEMKSSDVITILHSTYCLNFRNINLVWVNSIAIINYNHSRGHFTQSRLHG